MFTGNTSIMKRCCQIQKSEERHASAKTRIFDKIEDIALEDLKIRPIIEQPGTYTYNTAQVIADYLKPLCSDNDCIIRNTDCCTMGGPLSVKCSDKNMTETEFEVVIPSKPQFNKQSMHAIINRRIKYQPDGLFQKLKSNHPNIKYTVEVKPENFLDSKIIYSTDVIITEVKLNERK